MFLNPPELTVECPNCFGSGWANKIEGVVLCPVCKGEGYIEETGE